MNQTAMANKRIPMRQCVGCNEMKTKREMIRIIKTSAEADEIFSMLMGDDVEPRREFIEKNATYANIDA